MPFSLPLRFLIVATLLTLATAVRAGESSYETLAHEHILAKYHALTSELADLSSKNRPESVKGLRKRVGAFKDALDIFIFALPCGEMGPRIRADFDEGYEIIGKYKDLYDVAMLEDEEAEASEIEYDEETLKERRSKMLKWRNELLEPGRKGSYTRFLNRIGKEERECEREKLPRFYWGAVDFHVDHDLSGVENVRALSVGLLERADHDYDDLDELGPLTEIENEDAFHDFRKRVRSVLKILATFKAVGPGDEESVEILKETVERFGQLNDTIVAYHIAVEEDRNKKAARLEEEIAHGWAELHDWTKEHEVEHALETLAESL